MTFLDTGVLVGALLQHHPEHAACREALGLRPAPSRSPSHILFMHENRAAKGGHTSGLSPKHSRMIQDTRSGEGMLAVVVIHST